jgi:ATP-dependent DNA ligase
MLQRSRRAVGFVEPCLPSPAKVPPSGPEIKHDGFRLMARRDAKGVRLITRNSHDFSERFAQKLDRAPRAERHVVA